MEVNTPASITAFRAKSAADKVLSYIWYIHVLVSVNTEARLRANIALVLAHAVSPSAASPPEDTLADERKQPNTQEQQQKCQYLTDYLIVWLFSHSVLPRLVDTAPVLAQANGYTCVLADVPVSFREEFCRRLYTLLFSKRIVEWPRGIDVPEPAIAAAEPIVSADDALVQLEGLDISPGLEQEDLGHAELDGFTDHDDRDSESLVSSNRPAASLWLRTPGLRSGDGGGDDDMVHMERAAYFGTVSDPLPMNYFPDWDWSRSGSGPPGSVDEYAMSGEHLKVRFSSPQERGRKLSEAVQTPPCHTNRNKTSSPPHAGWQDRGNKPVMYGDEIGAHGYEVSRWPSSIATGSGVPRFDRGQNGTDHAASKQPVVSDDQRCMEVGWEKRLTGAGYIWNGSSKLPIIEYHPGLPSSQASRS